MSELFTITHDELENLRHLGPRCFMIYVGCLRPYLDYNTGLVGIKRKISLQQMTEYLYQPSRPGVKEKKLTRTDCKRLLQRMHDCNMIEIVDSKKLILRLPKALRSNEVDTDVDTLSLPSKPFKLQLVNFKKDSENTEVDMEVDTPLYNNKYNIIPSGGVTLSGDMCITNEDKMYKEEKLLKTLIPEDWKPNKVSMQMCSDYKLCLSRQVKAFIKYNQTKGSRFHIDEWDTIFSSWLQRAQIFAERRRNTKKVSTDKKTDSFVYEPYLSPKTALSRGFSKVANNSTIYVQSFEECRDLIKNKLKSNIRTVSEKTALKYYIPIYQRLIKEKRDAERKK